LSNGKKMILRDMVDHDEIRESLINVRVTDDQLEMIKRRAKRYANGNMSAWLRYAACYLDPRDEDLVSLKD
jgi:hypothetical protein